MLADIQVSKNTLRPFHLVFTNFMSSVQTLEPALLQKSRTGGRGKNSKPARNPCKKAKIASKAVKKTGLKKTGRTWEWSGVFFVVSFSCPKICLRPGVPRFGGGPGSINGGMFYAPVWREHKMLGPLHLRTNFCLFELFNLTNQVCTAAEKRCVNVYIYRYIYYTYIRTTYTSIWVNYKNLTVLT